VGRGFCPLLTEHAGRKPGTSRLSAQDQNPVSRFWKFGDTNSVSAKHLGGYGCRVVARPKDNNAGSLKPGDESLEIAVRRDQNEPVRHCPFQDAGVALTRQSVAQGALGPGEKIVEQTHEFRREAFIEQQPHPVDVRRSVAASSAA